MKSFAKQTFARGTSILMGTGMPTATVSFSPHSKANADKILNAMVKKINGVKGNKSSVLFSVMQLGGGGPVLKKLREIHKGPVFTDLLLVDEVNRMPPRTQAALLAIGQGLGRQIGLTLQTYQLQQFRSPLLQG